MTPETLRHMEPDLEMVAELLGDAGIACRIFGKRDPSRFRGVRLYTDAKETDPHLLYLLRPEDAERFPFDRACVSAVRVDGAPCLHCPGMDTAALLDQLNALFDRFQRWEQRLDELVYQNVTLEALCECGAEMLENPVCVHDDWFVMIARSRELPDVLPPDTIMTSEREFLPRVVMEDFVGDTEYLETYQSRTPQIWEGTPNRQPWLYVNLWAGEVYRGRLLVVQYHRALRKTDYLLSDVLAQRMLSLLDRKQLGVDRPHRGLDDIVFDLLNGARPETDEITRLMDALNWNARDRVVCVRLQEQQDGGSAMLEHALHSELFQAFPSGYIMFNDREQCVLLNLSRAPMSLAMIRHTLSPLCRDYCLYAGMSSPVDGLGEWHVAWLEAFQALSRAYERRDDKWIVPFSDCSLDLMLNSLQSPLQPRHMVAPELVALMEYDRQNDTQYFDTLRVFLLEERNIPRTSQRLIIHRTTLLYRLRKIENLVTLNLNDPWRRMYLLLSLKILEQSRT